ncbi:MAG: Bacitracin resistance protein BacA [Verrucomicrobia bacterium]|nr:Bacitracin resistance protein BacA [Verrucomicrobiota bacterium]
MRRFLTVSFLFIGIACAALAAPPPEPSAAAELKVRDAIILGIVEGVTEYLPVSSTGHLIIATHLLGLESNRTLVGRDGQPLWFKAPSARYPHGIPLTTKLAADTYTIVIQFGAIAAVAFLYWRQIGSMINGLLGRDPAGLRLLRNLIVAFLPAAFMGFALHSWIDEHLFSIGAVIAAQALGAILILWAERYRRRRVAEAKLPTQELSPKESLGIGFLQCVALWPGTSRSMMTIVGGYIVGLDPRRAAEFSFLLGFVTLSAATVFKSAQSGHAMIQVFGWTNVLLGCVVAAVSAAIAVRFLVNWLSRHGMAVFAYYRLAFALVLAAITWL